MQPFVPILLLSSLSPLSLLLAGEAAKQHLLYLDDFKPDPAPADLNLTVRVDFFRPNANIEGAAPVPDGQYFAPGTDKDKRFPWAEILLVNAKPGVANGANKRIQIRAK